MLFTSYGFILFIAILLGVYYIFPKKYQWTLLLAASYFFYAFSGIENFAFILFTTVSCFFVARIIEKRKNREDEYVANNKDTLDKEQRKAYRAKEKKKRFHILLLGLLLNFGMLAVIKYTAFALKNVNSVLKLFGVGGFGIPDLLLPLGISFFVFQSTGYLIDVYRGKTYAEKNIAKLALFVSFFPQIAQEPISRHGDLAAQLYEPHKFNAKSLKFGLQRILWGYFKKLVIADRILIVIKAMLNDTATFDGVYVILLILLYSAEIYADFTGGIDITIGLSEAMGIRLKENFNHPFSSRSTKEYWNRWHITMGSWFTDYVFYPLSVTKPMMKLSKWSRAHLGNTVGKRLPVYLATTVTWFLTGLWHGAAWNFIVWGLLNCLVILVSQEFEPLYRRFRNKFPRLTASYGYHCFEATRTLLLMGLIRSLDCYANVGLTFKMWGSMFTLRNWSECFGGQIFELGLELKDYVVLAVAIIIVAIVSRLSQNRDLREWLYGRTTLSWTLSILLLLAIILFGAYGIGYDASQFIYTIY
ncbi:MAG: MBOAT family protein [Clostridia bacterium]|nr:MBOAT family protein [Clostridia bacterium]